MTWLTGQERNIHHSKASPVASSDEVAVGPITKELKKTMRTQTKTIYDWDGEAEGRLGRKRIPFDVTPVPVPTTDPRKYEPWLPVLTLRAVCHVQVAA